MKVLVIGGSGFIGSHVVDRLLAHGHSVRVFDRQPERFRAPLPEVDYRFGEFADKMALVEALSGMDAVFHLLSTTVPGTADLDPTTDVHDNLVGAINLLEFDAAAWPLSGFCSCLRAEPSMEYRTRFRFRRRMRCARSIPTGSSRRRSNTIWKCIGGREASRQSSCGRQIRSARGRRIPASRV